MEGALEEPVPTVAAKSESATDEVNVQHDPSDGPPLTLVDLLQSSLPSSADFSSPATTSYLDQLLSLSLNELLRQPALISAESSTVESDLTNLCFREYPTFISVHKCSSAVKSAFDDFSGSLGKLIGAVPSLEDECRTFSTTTGSIQRVRGKAALVQEHQDKLLDLLELPQLMETCVRNGYYQEAMELLNHCHSLSQRYPTVALVQDVAKEVEGILQLMLAQLLALLREPVKLPALVKTVSFLRRLDAMDESELGLVFISSRYHNFRTQLLSIEKDKSEPVRYLRRYIDLFREHVYDIIAQFTAIFLESSPSDVAAIHITSFANQAITELVELVTACVPRMSSDSASMSSILVQLGYCAMSFSRVGLDFAPLISAPFSSTVLATFSQSLATSANEFASILQDSAKAVLPPSQILVEAEHIPYIVSSHSSPPPLPPIESASQFPPIAALVNAHLAALNNLRLLAPLNNHSQIVSLHTASLLSSSNVLLQYITQATTLSEPPANAPKDKRSHTRTPSAPRADLLRRNSEVQMTPEARAAKRREAKRVCVASADIWCGTVVPFLVDKLSEGVFADVPAPAPSKDLHDKLEELKSWVKQNGEGIEEATAPDSKMTTPPLNGYSGVVNGILETPPPISRPTIPTTPPSFSSPFKAAAQIVDEPHSDGINAVFESPRATAGTSRARRNESTVPEPADLRDSADETVQNMEAQLEAMSIGLSGEEAAVASEVTHSIAPRQRAEVAIESENSGKALEKGGEEEHSEVTDVDHASADIIKVEQPDRLVDAIPTPTNGDIGAAEQSAIGVSDTSVELEETQARPDDASLSIQAIESKDVTSEGAPSEIKSASKVDTETSELQGDETTEIAEDAQPSASESDLTTLVVPGELEVPDSSLGAADNSDREAVPVANGSSGEAEQVVILDTPGATPDVTTGPDHSSAVVKSSPEIVSPEVADEQPIEAAGVDEVPELKDGEGVTEKTTQSEAPTADDATQESTIPPSIEPSAAETTVPEKPEPLTLSADTPAIESAPDTPATPAGVPSAPASAENSRPTSPNGAPAAPTQTSNASKKKKKKKKGKS